MNKRNIIEQALEKIFAGISDLKIAFPEKEFTIDGRLVGDIGEVVAALEYDITLYKNLKAGYDGETSDGRKVQIKATFGDSLTFKTIPDYYLGLRLSHYGRHEEIFNGPGRVIYQQYSHRKGIGEMLLSFPNEKLRNLSTQVENRDRIPKREG